MKRFDQIVSILYWLSISGLFLCIIALAATPAPPAFPLDFYDPTTGATTSIGKDGLKRVQYNKPPVAASDVKVPLYGASFVGPDNNAEDRLTRMEKKIDALTLGLDYILKYVKKNEQLEAEAQKTPASDGSDPLVVSALQKCAKCHHAAVADSKGNGYAMFNDKGKFVLATPRELRKQVKRVRSEDPAFVMPPPGKGADLTQQERERFCTVALAEADKQEHNAQRSP